MESLWATLYDLLFEPRNAMAKIAERKNVVEAFLVAVVSICIPIWALSLEIKDTSMATMINVMLGIKIVASIFVWFITAAIWHLIAELFGGKGTAVGLVSTLGFAHLPRIFIIPLWALISVMPPSSKTLLMALAVLTILFWSLTLDVIAIREVHQLSTTKAILIMIMPMLVLAGVFLSAVIFISSSVMHMNMWL